MVNEKELKACIAFINDAVKGIGEAIEANREIPTYFWDYLTSNKIMQGRLAVVVAYDPDGSVGVSLRHSHSSYFVDDWYYADDYFDHWDEQNFLHLDRIYFEDDEEWKYLQLKEVAECEGDYSIYDESEIPGAAKWVLEKYHGIMELREKDNIEI